MKLGELMAEERELVFRSLVLCGLHIVVTLSNDNGRFDFSDPGLSEKEVKEIHVFQPLSIIKDKIESIGFKLKGIVDGWHIFAPEKLVLHHPGFSGQFEPKDKVMLNMSYLNSPAGSIAVITDKQDGIFELLTEYMDTLMFREREAVDHLIYICSNTTLKALKKA